MKDTTRLSHQMRVGIKDAIVAHRFGPEFKVIRELTAKIAEKAYEIAFTEQERTLLASLPEGWLEHQGGIDVTVGGHKHWIKFSGESYYRYDTIRAHLPRLEERVDVRRPMPDRYEVKVSAASELGKSINQVEQHRAKVEEAFAKALTQINTMLKSYSTIGTLKAAWPEVAPFLPKTAPTPQPANLPAISIPNLNQMLGLPV